MASLTAENREEAEQLLRRLRRNPEQIAEYLHRISILLDVVPVELLAEGFVTAGGIKAVADAMMKLENARPVLALQGLLTLRTVLTSVRRSIVPVEDLAAVVAAVLKVMMDKTSTLSQQEFGLHLLREALPVPRRCVATVAVCIGQALKRYADLRRKFPHPHVISQVLHSVILNDPDAVVRSRVLQQLPWFIGTLGDDSLDEGVLVSCIGSLFELAERGFADEIVHSGCLDAMLSATGTVAAVSVLCLELCLELAAQGQEAAVKHAPAFGELLAEVANEFEFKPTTVRDFVEAGDVSKSLAAQAVIRLGAGCIRFDALDFTWREVDVLPVDAALAGGGRVRSSRARSRTRSRRSRPKPRSKSRRSHRKRR
jgi:hypothetical protein